MTDRNPYIATKYPHLALVERTEPKPGQIILMRHGAYRVREGGGYEPARVEPAVMYAPAPTPWTVLHGHGWEAVAGVTMGFLILAVAMIALAVW